MADEETIWVVTDDTLQIEVPGGTKGGSGTGGSWGEETQTEIPGTKGVGTGVKVRVEKLEQEMTSFLQVVGRLFNRAEQQAHGKSGMQLDEIELSVEISGEGEVKLVGTGGKAAGKGAIKLKFKRAQSKGDGKELGDRDRH
jgi:hypothetical protein